MLRPSFLTLGIFWFGVTLMPFSTRLLGDFPRYRLALIVYWLNLLFLGVASGRASSATRRATP